MVVEAGTFSTHSPGLVQGTILLLDFGAALQAAKNGAKIVRNGWNGKGMHLEIQRPDANSKMGHPYFYMKGVDGKFFPWNPNNLDLMAEDWIVLE